MRLNLTFVDANPVCDASAMQAIKLTANNLRQAVANGGNVKARENMAMALLLAGMAFNNANLDMFMQWRTSWEASTICPTVLQCASLPTVEE